MKYQAVIFDLDGTTADTLGGITAAINRALTVCGLPGHTEDGVRRFVNYGTSRFVAEAVPEKLRHDDGPPHGRRQKSLARQRHA